MTSRFESTTTADVEEALKEFLHLGLLETASSSSPSWDPYQIERYSRNLGFFEMYATLEDSKYAFQERLFDARIAVLGLGGVGSHVALNLVGMGVGHLTILTMTPSNCPISIARFSIPRRTWVVLKWSWPRNGSPNSGPARQSRLMRSRSIAPPRCTTSSRSMIWSLPPLIGRRRASCPGSIKAV